MTSLTYISRKNKRKKRSVLLKVFKEICVLRDSAMHFPKYPSVQHNRGGYEVPLTYLPEQEVKGMS